jgi:hypothetical protein
MISLLSYLRVGFLGVGVLLSPVLVAAGTITLQDAQAQTLGAGTCKFDKITGDANGDFIAYCTSTAVSDAFFNVLAGGQSSSNVVKGASLPLAVTRSGTNLGVVNNVKLALPTGAALPVGATGEVSFPAGATSSTPPAFGDVTFSVAGEAVFGLVNFPSGATVNQARVTVTDVGTNGCTNPIGSTYLGYLPAGASSGYDVSGTLALKFNISSSDRVGSLWFINYETHSAAPLGLIDSAISTCPGDFTAIGIDVNKAVCIVKGGDRYGPTMSVSSGKTCVVKPGVDYYLNIKATTGDRLTFRLAIGGG